MRNLSGIIFKPGGQKEKEMNKTNNITTLMKTDELLAVNLLLKGKQIDDTGTILDVSTILAIL